VDATSPGSDAATDDAAIDADAGAREGVDAAPPANPTPAGDDGGIGCTVRPRPRTTSTSLAYLASGIALALAGLRRHTRRRAVSAAHER
jgi:hypothetical protein